MAEEATNMQAAAAEAGAQAQTAAAPARGRGGPGGRGGDNRRRGPRQDQPQEEKQFDERTLHIDRVARVVKGGRRFRFRALVVVGDKKGKVGIGIAKGADVTAAVSKATEVAKKHFIKINTYKDTLPHEAQAKVGGAVILLKPASAGTGLIAGGVVRTVLEVAGIKNALSKSLGSTNKVNSAYATIKALESVQPSSKWITTKPNAKKTTKKTEKVAA
jgi:small subunit ribosomal protein S5